LAKVGLLPFYRDAKAMKALVLEEQVTAERLWPQ
jgi:hypothetical protein